MTRRRQGLVVKWAQRRLSLEVQQAGCGAVHRVEVAGQVVGAVWGFVDELEADRIVRALQIGDVADLPDRPWLAAACTPDELVAACSPMIPGGLFWGHHRAGGIVVGSDPSSVAEAADISAVNSAYVRDFLLGAPRSHETAWVGVQRLEPGWRSVWDAQGASTGLAAWCGPEVWAEPHLEGPDAISQYLASFDRVVAGLLPWVGQPVLSLSGGLDSTFVSAAVCAQSGPGPALALHDAPLPAARVTATTGWDSDETHLAELMTQHTSGRMRLSVFVNQERRRPLAAAAEAAARSGTPAWGPANQVWVNAFDRMAAESGARAWFTGSHGNAAFSNPHVYAAEYYIRRGMPIRAQRLGMFHRHPTRTRIVRSLRVGLGAARNRPTMVEEPVLLPGVPARRYPHTVGSGRARWLEWLAYRGRPVAAARNPAAADLLQIDPFTAPSLLAVAAAITPAEWQRGGLPRAFARRAGVGRVPDAIRLRTRRGAQGGDTWYVIRHDRDEYLDRIAALPSITGLEEVDHQRLLRHVAKWPWGGIVGPPRPEIRTLNRLLALADFTATLGG